MAAYVYRNENDRLNRIFATLLVIILHGIVIVFLLNLTSVNSSKDNPALQLVQLKPTNVESVEIREPLIDLSNPRIHFEFPAPEKTDINFSDYEEGVLAPMPSDNLYQLPDENSKLYPNVFDPRLRKKLIDSKAINRPRQAEKSESWTEADGRTFVDMGNGRCLVSMPKVDSRDRGTSWGHTRCGKTDSEEAMDRVMADFEGRKAPP